MSQDQDLTVGDVLASRYKIEERLADGGMGAVYRARHVKVGRPFAIKILHPSLLEDAKIVKRFEREAELAGRLRHTNVASVVDVGETDRGMRYMAMEFAPGVALVELLADGPLAESRVLDLAKQLCAGLQHAHEVGLIHRDFKPDNVLIEQLPGGREVARIVDWGVAILREDYSEPGDGARAPRLTTKGIVVGTPHYMSPEQATGERLDHRADLFALGLICYELLTGKLPFDGSGAEVARANLTQSPPPMRDRGGVQVDPVLEGVVRKLLEKSPAQRPQSANEARDLFELYERDRTACARLLGVKLALGSGVSPATPPAATAATTPVAGAPIPKRAREQYRTTAAIRVQKRPRNRRIAVFALLGLAGLVFVLWLALRGDDRTPVAHSAPDDAALVVMAPEPAPPEPAPPAVAVPDEEPSTPVPAPTKAAPVRKAAPQVAANLAPRPAAKTVPSANEVAELYAQIGRDLRTLEEQKGLDATIELWPRYRWIRIQSWIITPERRSEAMRYLERLATDIKKH